jgi:hypothetical protein
MRCQIRYAGFFLVAISLLLACGCGPQFKTLPPETLNDEFEMGICVKDVPEKPSLLTSGGGGLIGLMVASSRESELEEKFKGVSGSALRELIQQNIANRLEDYFEIIDPEEKPRYISNVKINQWGWYLPTGMFGIKTGVYNFRIGGQVEVRDSKLKDEEEGLAYYATGALVPIGNEPTTQQIKQAMIKCADKFAEQAVSFLVNKK